MAKTMTKAKIVETLAAKTGFTKEDVSNLLTELTALACKKRRNPLQSLQ